MHIRFLRHYHCRCCCCWCRRRLVSLTLLMTCSFYWIFDPNKSTVLRSVDGLCPYSMQTAIVHVMHQWKSRTHSFHFLLVQQVCNIAQWWRKKNLCERILMESWITSGFEITTRHVIEWLPLNVYINMDKLNVNYLVAGVVSKMIVWFCLQCSSSLFFLDVFETLKLCN